MITCHLTYIVDPQQLDAFEEYGRHWIDLVNEMGGHHHGYLLPHEGANNVAFASFSFPSLAAYEEYRNQIPSCEKCSKVLANAEKLQFIISYERSFMRPVFRGFVDTAKIK